MFSGQIVESTCAHFRRNVCVQCSPGVAVVYVQTERIADGRSAIEQERRPEVNFRVKKHHSGTTENLSAQWCIEEKSSAFSFEKRAI